MMDACILPKYFEFMFELSHLFFPFMFLQYFDGDFPPIVIPFINVARRTRAKLFRKLQIRIFDPLRIVVVIHDCQVSRIVIIAVVAIIGIIIIGIIVIVVIVGIVVVAGFFWDGRSSIKAIQTVHDLFFYDGGKRNQYVSAGLPTHGPLSRCRSSRLFGGRSTAVAVESWRGCLCGLFFY